MSDPDWTIDHARPNVAAGVLFTDEEGRVLMVEPTYKSYLDIPGGYVEKGETPHEAAEREVFEELGIKPAIGRLLVADWWNDSPETGLSSKLLLVFDGKVLQRNDIDSIRVDGGEIRDSRFLDPAHLVAVTIKRLSDRVQSALSARANDSTLYLESGLPAEY